MISLQASKEILSEESLSKKRKWDDLAQQIFENPENKIKTTKSPVVSDPQNHSTPSPSDWQRCLDIKSGQMYLYNTRNNKRAIGDPRSTTTAAEPVHNPAAPMSLELELNLPSQSDPGAKTSIYSNHNFMNSKDVRGSLSRSPSWLTFEGEQQEMVTAVCKKCYMLVMMCKSSPTCPNCKFMHPLDPSSKLFNQESSN